MSVEGRIESADLDGHTGRVHEEALEDGGLHVHCEVAMQVGELQACGIR